MKTQLLILALVLLMIPGQCVSEQDRSRLPAATSDVMPRLDPSPTPLNSTLPLTCQVTDLNVYINETDGYCFAYPVRFTPDDLSKPGIRGPALDDSLTPTFATFGVEVKPAATDKTLREQAEAYLLEVSDFDPATYNWSQIQVAGEPAWQIEPVPSIGAWRIVFLVHNGNLFRLMYWPVDNPIAEADVEELTQTTLGSFAFIK